MTHRQRSCYPPFEHGGRRYVWIGGDNWNEFLAIDDQPVMRFLPVHNHLLNEMFTVVSEPNAGPIFAWMNDEITDWCENNISRIPQGYIDVTEVNTEEGWLLFASIDDRNLFKERWLQ